MAEFVSIPVYRLNGDHWNVSVMNGHNNQLPRKIWVADPTDSHTVAEYGIVWRQYERTIRNTYDQIRDVNPIVSRMDIVPTTHHLEQVNDVI